MNFIISDIFAEINQSTPLAPEKKKSNGLSRKHPKNKKNLDVVLTRWISRKLIVDRSRWKTREIESESIDEKTKKNERDKIEKAQIKNRGFEKKWWKNRWGSSSIARGRNVWLAENFNSEKEIIDRLEKEVSDDSEEEISDRSREEMSDDSEKGISEDSEEEICDDSQEEISEDSEEEICDDSQGEMSGAEEEAESKEERDFNVELDEGAEKMMDLGGTASNTEAYTVLATLSLSVLNQPNQP